MNTIKRYPLVGDIAVLHEGKVRFLGQDATSEFVNKQQCIGVVYYVQGKEVKLVGGIDNDKLLPWSIACDFEITTIPQSSGDCAVKLQNVDLGNFTYTKTSGTKVEFVAQLNTWLATHAPKWEAYMHQGKAILQLTDYNAFESNCSIANCTLVKKVGEEVAFTDSWSSIRNQIKQSVTYCGMCRPKLGEWARVQTAPNNNPTTRMDGVKKLFETFPCSEAYYNGELGDGLRANFATYEDYLDACMMRSFELREIMQYRDGAELCKLMNNKTLLVRGVETPAYSALRKACDYDSGVAGFGKGKWHLPTMHELSLLMRYISYGTKEPLDLINKSLEKKQGWSRITAYGSRWSCCRCNVNNAWFYYSIGISGNGYFYSRLCVSAVSALTLENN